MRARSGSALKNVYTLGIAARKAEPRLFNHVCMQGHQRSKLYKLAHAYAAKATMMHANQ